MSRAYKVNLLPARLQREGIVDFRRLALVTAVALLAALAVGSYSLFLFNFHTVKKELAETQQQLALLTPLAARAEGIKKERTNLEAALAEYSKIVKKHLAWSSLLAGLGEEAPADLCLTWLEISYVKPEGKGPAGNAADGAMDNQSAGGGAGNSQPAARPAPNTVIFKGYAQTVPSVGKFINNLCFLPYFSEVELNKISAGDQGLVFEITSSLKERNQ